MHFIYALTCPFEGVVRYIGKTDKPEHRLRQHISNARRGDTRHYCANWINHLLAQNESPRLEVLCGLPEGENWQAVERLLIGFCKIVEFDLTNVTEGGEGVIFTCPESRRRQVEGRRATMAKPEVRERWTESLRAAFARPEFKTRKAEAVKVILSNPEFVARHAAAVSTPAELQRKSKAMLEIWQRPDYLDQMRAIAKDRIRELGALDRLIAAFKAADAVPENRAKRLAAAKATMATPESKSRQSAAATEVNARPEVKAARSAALKADWADPEQRAKREAALALAKPAMSASKKAAWADPQKAAHIKAAQRAAWADPAKKERALANRKAMWADPVQRAALIEKQKAAWIKRRQPKEASP